ncbi:MAG: hypothetical protein IKJ62_04330 [Alphaproteobacteria bacterium]|nr:hypothetical protein [Alphaproteobacteria bacterium]
MKKIILCSLVAMMAVTAANAEIASVDYLEAKTGDIATLTTTAKSNLTAAVNELDGDIENINNNKQNKIEDLEEIRAGAALGATSFQAAKVAESLEPITPGDEDEVVPTVARTESMISASHEVLVAKDGEQIDDADLDEVVPTLLRTENLINNTQSSLTGIIGDVPDNTTVVEMIGDAQATADAAVKKEQVGIGENFAISDKCKAADAVCSLVVRAGVAGWEEIRY